MRLLTKFGKSPVCSSSTVKSLPISSFVDGTSELLDKILVDYGLSDTLGTQYASIDGMLAKFEKKQTQKPPV